MATAATYAVSSAIPIAAASLASFGVLLIPRKDAPTAVITIANRANQLTLLRLLLLCYVAAQLGNLDWRWILALFTANVLLDVADGLIARRLQQASSAGMVFDREVDGIYVLVACLYFNLEGGIGAWILVPGLLPYLYRLVAWTLRNPPVAGRKQRHAAFLAGVNFVLLLLAVALPPGPRLIVLVISTAIVTLSFFISFRELARYRHDNSLL